MALDTDDLFTKTYKAIMVEAEKFDHNLTLQLGILSYECDSEKEYIAKSEKLIRKMLKYNEDAIDDIFFGEPPAKEKFHRVLNKILTNISKLNR